MSKKLVPQAKLDVLHRRVSHSPLKSRENYRTRRWVAVTLLGPSI